MYDLDARLTGAQAASVAGVSRQLIRRWCQLGHLTPVGQRGRSPLYRLGDVIKAEHATRESGRSSRAA